MVLFASGIMFVTAVAEAKAKFERFHREIAVEVTTKEISIIINKNVDYILTFNIAIDITFLKSLTHYSHS